MRKLQKDDLINGAFVLTYVQDVPGSEEVFEIRYTIPEKPSYNERPINTVYFLEMDMRSANFDFETTSKKMPVSQFLKDHPYGRQIGTNELNAIRQIFRKIREQKTA